MNHTNAPTEMPPDKRGRRLFPAAWDLSYRVRLLASICTLVLLTGVAITWLAHRSARAGAEVLAQSLFREVSEHAVTHTRSFVLRAAPLVESLRQLADNGRALE